jgi:hypothetical protein
MQRYTDFKVSIDTHVHVYTHVQKVYLRTKVSQGAYAYCDICSKTQTRISVVTEYMRAVGLYVVYGELVCAICTGMSLAAICGFLLFFVREYILLFPCVSVRS